MKTHGKPFWIARDKTLDGDLGFSLTELVISDEGYFRNYEAGGFFKNHLDLSLKKGQQIKVRLEVLGCK